MDPEEGAPGHAGGEAPVRVPREGRWIVTGAVLVLITPPLLMPARLTLGPTWPGIARAVNIFT